MVVLFSNIQRNFYTVFHSGSINLHSHRLHKASLLSTLSPILVIFDFLIIAILTGVRCYLIVVLIFISLMISDIECLYIYLLAICMSSQRNVYLGPLPIFKAELFVCVCFFFSLLSCISSLYILDINPLLDTWFANTFFLFHRLPFHFVGCLLCRSFSVCYSPPPLFLLLLPVLLVSIPKNHCQGQHQGAFHLLPFTL